MPLNFRQSGFVVSLAFGCDPLKRFIAGIARGVVLKLFTVLHGDHIIELEEQRLVRGVACDLVAKHNPFIHMRLEGIKRCAPGEISNVAGSAEFGGALSIAMIPKELTPKLKPV